ncbi:hypothetical protein F4821DRAFT_247832 [Hypoxylon rubiginosum]|uniref:Uncharacterized protein n=1 Tax=Hypoxylon rubiginosum TaxID=110542 RepID=A0ACC0CNY7_9PEZI|nr:hypothetical protein F4821DRAFT_247832 [Hypoxylon rubiginosum]
MHDGPRGGFEIDAPDMEEQAAKCALALAHFCRFNQIRDMKHSVLLGAQIFNLTLERTSPSEEVLNGAVIPAGTAIKLQFQNLDSDPLYFRCVSLNANLGVHAHQVYPGSGNIVMGVASGKTLTVLLESIIPEMEEGEGRVRHIIRVVVSRRTRVIYPSLRHLQLPDIGNAVPDSVLWGYIRDEDTGVSPENMYNFPWWIRDLEFWIEPASSESQEQEEETTTT